MNMREPEERKTEEPARPGARTTVERTDPPDLNREPEELRRELEDTHAEMGETVETLAQETDIKPRVSDTIGERTAALRKRRDSAKARALEARERVAGATPDDAKRVVTQLTRSAEERPLPAIGVAAAAGFVLGVLLGRR
jgi:ElaB/YqjD/DUF883 family membrane-anchored ribosome-binding protein